MTQLIRWLPRAPLSPRYSYFVLSKITVWSYQYTIPTYTVMRIIISVCGNSPRRSSTTLNSDWSMSMMYSGRCASAYPWTVKDQLQRSKKIRNLAVVCWIISYYRHLYHENLDSSLYLLKKIHFRNPFLPRYIARFAKGACRHRLINISWIQLFPPLDDVRPGKRYTSWFTCYTSNA